MQINFGLNSFRLSKGVNEPVTWDSSQAVNPHMLIMGMTGSGKTHKLRKVINNLSHQAIESGLQDFKVHVFDVHGDIRGVHESVVNYSESAGFGINPLTLSPDPDHGGVRKRINSFLNTLQTSTAKMGVRQEAVATSLFEDLYAYYGFRKDDYRTWDLNTQADNADGMLFLDVPYEERSNAKKYGAKWNPAQKSWYIEAINYQGEIEQYPVKDLGAQTLRRYPTLDDASKFFYAKMEEAFIGIGREGALALKAFHKATSKYNTLLAKSHYGDTNGNVRLTTDEQEKIEKAAKNVRTTLEDYLANNGTEKTLKEAILYSSLDTLTSINQRINNLIASGVFRDNPPPLDPMAPVHRHALRALSHEEQKMFVLFSLERIFEDALQKGETRNIRDVVVVDEASKFFDNDPRNPLNVIALEGRKFGICLICASQAPTHFSESFLGSVATKVILGLDEMYWESSRRKLNIDADRMKWVTPQKEMLVQIKQNGVSINPWIGVSIGDGGK
ncbi:MAG: ATP-binding protein [Methyloprofundus sp.]|nr:ATP-binding protein [Methyloprofundus sp.]